MSDNSKRTVAVFDFDGTLTTRDSMLEFIAFAFGRARLLWGLLCCSPTLLAYSIGLCRRDKAKQQLLAHFFSGMTRSRLGSLGELFASRIDTFANRQTLAAMESLCSSGDCTVYVISASVSEWVAPWCRRHGVINIICTEMEATADGRLTGRLAGKNCHGREKAIRLLAAEPCRDSYRLLVYGDSSGDADLMAIADERHWVKR